jgi:hypothetical protein
MAEAPIGNRETQDMLSMLDATGAMPTLWRTMLLDVPSNVTSELMRFSARRCEAQADYFNELNHCRTIPDLLNTQTTFLRNAADDCSAEPGRLLDCFRSDTARVHA